MPFPLWIFPGLLKDPPLSKNKGKHTTLPAQTRDGSFLEILCAKKSLWHPLAFSKHSKTRQEKKRLKVRRTSDLPDSVPLTSHLIS